MTPTELFAKARRLSRGDWLELLNAQVALLGAQVLIWTRRQGRLVGGISPADQLPEAASMGNEAAAMRLHEAIRRAARYGLFRPGCLVRAIALFQLLERRGMQSCFRVGVRTHAGQLLAHAWVEYGRLVLDESPTYVRHFRSLRDLALFPAAQAKWR